MHDLIFLNLFSKESRGEGPSQEIDPMFETDVFMPQRCLGFITNKNGFMMGAVSVTKYCVITPSEPLLAFWDRRVQLFVGIGTNPCSEDAIEYLHPVHQWTYRFHRQFLSGQINSPKVTIIMVRNFT